MTLPVLPYGTPLGVGPNAIAWAQSILQALGAPRNEATVGSLLAWFQREGGGGENNPLNTTLDTPDATASINSDGVKNYRTPAAGVVATVLTLRSYPAIVARLRAGGALDQPNSEVSAELSRWSGGGYDILDPIKVTLPTPAAGGVFSATITVDAAGKWNVHNPVPGQLGGARDKWWFAELALNRATGEWKIRGTRKLFSA